MDGYHITTSGKNKTVVLLSDLQVRSYGSKAAAEAAFPGVTIMPSAVIEDYWPDIAFAREVGHA